MQSPLSDAFIQRLTPAENGRRYEVRDSKFPGLVLLVGKLKRTFYLHTSLNGKQVKIRLGEFGALTAGQARIAAQQALERLNEETLPRFHPLTLQVIFDEYLAARRLRQDSVDSYRKIARLYLSDLMPLAINKISPGMCLERYVKLRNDKSPSKANDALRVLSMLFNYAAAVHEMVLPNIRKRVVIAGAYQKTPARSSMLDERNLRAWFDSLKPRPLHYRVMLFLAVTTGLRRAEIERLKWRDIDTKEGLIIARETKNHRDHILPTGEGLTTILRLYWEVQDRPNPDTAVFGARPDRWADLASRKGGIKFSLHALRRTFVSLGVLVTGNISLVKRLVNHASSNVTEFHYVRFVDHDLRKAMQKIEVRFLRHVDLNSFFTELLPSIVGHEDGEDISDLAIVDNNTDLPFQISGDHVAKPTIRIE